MWSTSRRAIDDAVARVCDAAAAEGKGSSRSGAVDSNSVIANDITTAADAAVAVEAKSLLHATAPNMYVQVTSTIFVSFLARYSCVFSAHNACDVFKIVTPNSPDCAANIFLA